MENVVYHLDESTAWFDGGLNVFGVDCYWLESSCIIQFLWCEVSRVKRVEFLFFFFSACIYFNLLKEGPEINGANMFGFNFVFLLLTVHSLKIKELTPNSEALK